MVDLEEPSGEFLLELSLNLQGVLSERDAQLLCVQRGLVEADADAMEAASHHTASIDGAKHDVDAVKSHFRSAFRRTSPRPPRRL